jgi:predicted RNA binding protein YcfA (HicA-like mRNA interferase family)
MGQYGKLVQRILSGQQDKSIPFSEALSLMQKLGFSIRVKGSHHIFSQEGIDEIINLQPNGSKAKPYQVKQIRDIIVKYQLGVEDE